MTRSRRSLRRETAAAATTTMATRMTTGGSHASRGANFELRLFRQNHLLVGVRPDKARVGHHEHAEFGKDGATKLCVCPAEL